MELQESQQKKHSKTSLILFILCFVLSLVLLKSSFEEDKVVENYKDSLNTYKAIYENSRIEIKKIKEDYEKTIDSISNMHAVKLDSKLSEFFKRYKERHKGDSLVR